MYLARGRDVRGESRLARHLRDDVRIRYVLERAHEAAAREAMQAIERTKHETLRSRMEGGLKLDDLAVEERLFVTFRLPADGERLSRFDLRFVQPFELRVVRHQRRHIRQMQ